MKEHSSKIEHHPLAPFLPSEANMLMLGSFPPSHERWSMEFFYPNFQNDMWRIMGLIFFDNKEHFVVPGERKFAYDDVVGFCRSKGIAIFDTATAVRRLNDNASDKFLEVVEATDIAALLAALPHCRAIVTTGEKATSVIAQTLGCPVPKVGTSCLVTLEGRTLSLFRMPSSSRAYPMSIENKSQAYRAMFSSLAMV